ncbi:hypothetical protein SVA_2711 [Sulfurifustis variabilis]|uniref:DUF4426 domain-containing protein n=1 Tax=Sulfurifustis variabilis TaxID=1675686 RepID=A0A1B4V6T6_9GAMM|nr:hypothetical protein [Sulfurifustis variabilis]BAU49259.1 hypothetical protein SVA_2711 [Sulfurifustis variabilis]
MRTGYMMGLRLVGVLALAISSAGHAASYEQVVDGIAIYFGVVPAELVRGHPREHPESGMHGGAPVGESHLMVALFDAKTGNRITDARIAASVTGDAGAKLEKRLEPMTVAGALTFGNYFYLSGSGPYRIDLQILLPGRSTPVRARFEWGRS